MHSITFSMLVSSLVSDCPVIYSYNRPTQSSSQVLSPSACSAGRGFEKSIYDLMAVQAKVTTFQKLSSPEELAHYTENVGRKEPANHLVQDKEYLQLLRDQKKSSCWP